jgi:hypothetical protein
MADGSYTFAQLLEKLKSPGWRFIADDSGKPEEGTLDAMAQAAHARKNDAPGYLQEVETEIEVDMLQLQELWQHLGLPV